MKSVSVVIPTYNRGFCIKKSIESAINQTYSPLEIIIADDCSSDNTEEVVKSINDPGVRYYKLPENKGAGGARNYGVSVATGDYIAFLDSDDCWTEDKLEKQMAYHELHPEYDMSYTSYLFHGLDGEEFKSPTINDISVLEGDILKHLLLRNTVGAPTVVIKKEVFDEVGGYDETMDNLEDWDFAIKVSQKHLIGYLPEVLLNVYQTRGSVSENYGRFYASRCSLFKKYKEDYIRTGTLDDAMLSVLKFAERDNVLDSVKKLLLLNLQ